jgi:predicted tellurium resistance membrane protein TerC
MAYPAVQLSLELQTHTNMEIFLNAETWIALLTLTFLEIVLGIDNIIFISIATGRLPEKQQPRVRTIGMIMALIFRILLLISITWIIKMTRPLFSIGDIAFSLRDIILLAGGIFLVWKSVLEIHQKTLVDEHLVKVRKKVTPGAVIFQIIILDMVFSFDSILTAIGLSNQLLIMISAVVIAMVVMISFAGVISRFINKNPTLQILALAFLILIGFTLGMEAFHKDVPKGYVYVAVLFSFSVELINLRIRRKALKRIEHEEKTGTK